MLGLVAVLALIAANGVFVAGEFALVAVDRTRLARAAEDGRRGARVVQQLLGRLSFHLSGAQFGITVTSLVLGFLAEPIIAALLEPLLEPLLGSTAVRGVSIALALILATFGQMVLGELVPKNVAIAKPMRTSVLLGRPLQIYGAVFGPVIRVLDAAANATVRALGIEPREELSTVRSLPELSLLIEASVEQGAIADSASQLFTRSVRFAEKTAADVLVPRVELTTITAEATVPELVQLAVATGHSRFPVHGADLDDIVGVVHVKRVHDVAVDDRTSTTVREIMTPPVVVPESLALHPLLVTMREGRQHLVLVVDEYGGTAGIVTLEDLLEEIVGEIDDEYDTFTPGVAQRLPNGDHILSGLLHPDEVAERCGLHLPEGEYETLAGFVLERLGHVPQSGETVEADGFRLEVLEMDRRRIASVLVRPPASEDGA